LNITGFTLVLTVGSAWLGGVYYPSVSETELACRVVDGGCLTTVDGSLGGGLPALMLSTLAPLAEVDFETASFDFWQKNGINMAFAPGQIRH
jgi:hypothetical protein